MARIRSIPIAIFTDEDFVSVSAFARLLFVGLGSIADGRGTFSWRPLSIKIKIFPADDVDVSALLAELETANLIFRFDSGAECWGVIRDFHHFRGGRKNGAN
ncbi:hypothetical protein [Ochrobactrum sp. AP1BH01-1]|uniref:hypothetical protein n=1 Tax=Ochrobactrum sp. AP1BH01-1 TaxID=2823874 RepID=UPI001B3974FD|nr:hypothetical protein [Ochrobactrum sp. AP1BH01-1]MBQ0707863.1 hypothetical protein [Ochrobactrum sp. AP1BH01-1]